MYNSNISVSNNQAFFQTFSPTIQNIIDTLYGWADQEFSIIDSLNYIIRNVNQYGPNSHPSQTTIGKSAGIKRWQSNKNTKILVELGLIIKTRVIKDGKETACEYALTPVLQDPKIRWALKDILPALKWQYIPKVLQSVTDRFFGGDHTPYIKIYFNKNYKIQSNFSKSSFREKIVQLSKKREHSMLNSYKTVLRKQEKEPQEDPPMYKPVAGLTSLQCVEMASAIMEEKNLNKRLAMYEELYRKCQRASQPFVQIYINKTKRKIEAEKHSQNDLPF